MTGQELPASAAEDHRRVLPRQPTDWVGSCRIEGKRRRHPCSVVDFSIAGATVHLQDETPLAIVGHQITVTATVRLHGHIRDVASTSDGNTRVGIEFSELDGAAREYLRLQREFGTRW